MRRRWFYRPQIILRKLIGQSNLLCYIFGNRRFSLPKKNRLKDISAMDIYSARIPLLSGPKNKAPAQDSGPEADADSDSEPTLQDQWMEFALLVEETQSVLFI